MSGYFNSLMKQSGVKIGAINSALAHDRAPRPVTADPVMPLHVETVALVGPAAAEVDHFSGKTTDTHPTDAFDQRLAPRDPISIESDVTTDIPPAVSNHLANQTEKAVADQPEADFVQERSISSVASETTVKTIPEVAVSINEVMENRTKTTPGVVRVGELRGAMDQELTTESDARSDVERTLARPEFSIPHDYLTGIREWLTSPPVNSEEIADERLIDRHHDNNSSTQRHSDPSLRPNIELDLSSNDELREFSLSIGTISIVVEEPARQQPQPSTNLQPVERAPANTQPRSRDAFALTRSYFRGF